ncbi:hypothetical protein BH23PLA1_BH23PLA1_11650 [soil metagenome]
MPSYSTTDTIWLAIGFLGQAAFTSRFLVQWLASERERNSVVPMAFWWLSLAGGLTLLSYAIHKQDPVIIVGQSCGIFIYIRNIFLSAQGRKRIKGEQTAAQSMLPPGTRPHLSDLEAPPKVPARSEAEAIRQS